MATGSQFSYNVIGSLAATALTARARDEHEGHRIAGGRRRSSSSSGHPFSRTVE